MIMAPMALSRWLFFKSASPLMSFHHIIIMMGRCGFERKLRKTLHQVMSNISESAQIRKGVKSPTQTNSTNSAGGKTLLGTHKHQETLPDTLPTNSFMTRVFPVPHAISIFLAPFAQASKQSCWHFLNGGSAGVASSWMPLLEVAPLATSLPETAGGYHVLSLFTATRNNKYSQGAEQFVTIDETL